MNDRQEKIYRLLERLGSASIALLKKEVYASEATLRRDLARMEQQGLLIRTWGGAVATGGVNADPPLFLRSKSNLPKKNIIADSATALIRDGMTLFLASGTTVERLAHNLLKFQNLTVITNGLDIAAALKGHPYAKVVLLGGEFYENYDLIGPMTENAVRQFNADLFFFSCSGITSEGFTAMDMSRLNIMREMKNHSSKRILLVDSSKVGKVHTYNGFSFEEIDHVVMDAPPKDPQLRKILAKKLIPTKN